jgi:hypothetical protein
MRLLSRSFLMVSVIAAASALGAGVSGAQAAATVCKDGTTSATSGRGACSGHGGIASKASKSKAATSSRGATQATAAVGAATTTAPAKATRATKASTRQAAEVSCTDGTMSKGGRGACSGHGGVKLAGAAAMAAPAPAAATAPTPAPARTRASAAVARTKASNATAGSGAADDNNPPGAIAKCKDGLYSHAAHRQGACSRHGGVASWM